MPPPDPVSRLLALAGEVGRFGDAIAAETDFDPRVFRAWQTELRSIAADLARAGADAHATREEELA